MKVILKQEVDGLGTIGDVVKVRDGYGRNFLIPQGHAIMATAGNLKAIEGEKKRLAKVKANSTSLADNLKNQLSGVVLNFKLRAGDDGKLFGSVTNTNVADALAEKGFTIDKRKVLVDHINHLGDYDVKIKLFGEIMAEVKVKVEAAD